MEHSKKIEGIKIGHAHQRPRRLRLHENLRSMVQETHLKKTDLIYPIFISEKERTSIDSLPGIFRFPLKQAITESVDAYKMGIRGIMIFPTLETNHKDLLGSYSYNDSGLIQQFVKEIKEKCPGLIVFADVALDPYTSHGHDGIVDENFYVLNDVTVEALCKQALSLAKSGVDFVCPSDMMDGRVFAIRNYLDEHGFINTGIMSYAAKYASGFYGPFRDALLNKSTGLDKKNYHMDIANSREAVREVNLDIAEGADMLVVKPGTLYLDIVSKVKEVSSVPIVSYHVSGEYCMLKLACNAGYLDEKKCVYETLMAFKRAGADLIISYYSKWACENLDLH